MDVQSIKYILENYTLNEHGQVKIKCVLSKNPTTIIGTAGPNHCPKCHSVKCPEYISFKKSIDDVKDKDIDTNTTNDEYDFKYVYM